MIVTIFQRPVNCIPAPLNESGRVLILKGKSESKSVFLSFVSRPQLEPSSSSSAG